MVEQPERSPAEAQSPDIEALVARAARGEETAWTQIVRAYAPRVYSLVQSRCRNHATSEEITQAVMASAALTILRGGYQEAGRFESWLFRITMNRVRDLVRSLKRRGSTASLTDGLDIASSPVLPHTGGETHQRLREALEQLPEVDREVVDLRHHAGLAFKEIAALLDEPVGTVLARHHRALAKLRTILGPDE